uniref:Uncharacterized protein n=1 Tax=Spongospora subterranea TaxID=70186 RepID=A0A0H5RDB1_9EUKA|eukprot:CRZ12235.1 hypothetical protein [Spongospora subterranea]
MKGKSTSVRVSHNYYIYKLVCRHFQRKIVVRLLTSLRYVSRQKRTSVKSEERGTGNQICNKGMHPTKSLRRKNLRASWISPPFFQQEENIKSTTKEKREKRRGKD